MTYKELDNIKTVGRLFEDGIYSLNTNDEISTFRSKKTGQAYSCRTELALEAIGRDCVPAGRRPSQILSEATLELDRKGPEGPEKLKKQYSSKPWYIV